MSGNDTLDSIFERLCTMEAPLNERLQLFSEALKNAEPHYASAYDTLVNRLKNARSGSSAPGVGDLMPSFTLPDGEGRMHDLDEYLARGPVVVSFNREGAILGRPKITHESEHASDHDRLMHRVAVMEALQRCTPLPFTEALGGAIAGRPLAIPFRTRNRPPPKPREHRAWLTPKIP